MSQVGSFPGMNVFRRTVRAPVNPLDKSTVISIYPKAIDEVKPTIQPGKFYIPPGSYDKPAILVVGPSSWWKELDEQQPLLEIPNSSIQIAHSIITDYSNGLLACNMGDAMPGLFYIPGEHTVASIQKDHKLQLDEANKKQKNWYATLVKLADIGWSRSNGNPLSVGDDMKMAARELGLIHKEWLKDSQAIELIRCIACGALRNPLFPICAQCKAVADPELAKKLNLTFAQ